MRLLKLFQVSATLVLALLAAPQGHAQAYPQRGVRIMVPYGTGGG